MCLRLLVQKAKVKKVTKVGKVRKVTLLDKKVKNTTQRVFSSFCF
jgi:hypothetical protein